MIGFRETHEGGQMKGEDRRGGHHHSGRHMKGDKAQTRQERRTPPLRETHERRQMKGDKAQTDRRGGHHHSGRHMKGGK